MKTHTITLAFLVLAAMLTIGCGDNIANSNIEWFQTKIYLGTFNTSEDIYGYLYYNDEIIDSVVLDSITHVFIPADSITVKWSQIDGSYEYTLLIEGWGTRVISKFNIGVVSCD